MDKNEQGMTTAEYAVGTVAAAGFGGGLLLITPLYFQILTHVLTNALTFVLRMSFVPPLG